MSEEVINSTSAEQYSANSIQVLEGLEAVRKRPSMYIGDVGERGLHHLVYDTIIGSTMFILSKCTLSKSSWKLF